MQAACTVVACTACNGTTCSSCATDFVLSPDGLRCVLPAEQTIIGVFQVLFVLIGAGISLGFAAKTALVCSAVLQSEACKCEETHALSPLLGAKACGRLSQKALNLQAIKRGMANWYRARLKYQRKITVTKDPASELAAVVAPVTGSCLGNLIWRLFDVHTRFIVGVGLPVFYNFHALPALAALLAIVATHGASLRSGYAEAAAVVAAMRDDRQDGPGTGAAHAQVALEEAAHRFAEVLRVHLAWLYVALLLISWLHAVCQKRWRTLFDMRNTTMADYSLHLWGLPRSETSEAALQAWLEKCFARPVVGVSIGYDLHDPAVPDMDNTIWGMKERLVVRMDTSLSTDAAKAGFGYPEVLADPEDLARARGRDMEDFSSIVKRLQGSGHAWVVFRSKADADFVRRTWRGIWVETEVEVHEEKEWKWLQAAVGGGGGGGISHLRHKVIIAGEKFPKGTIVSGPPRLASDGRRLVKLKKLVELSHTEVEPPSVLWQNLGTRPKVMRKRLQQTVVIVFIVFLVLLLLVFLPLGLFLLKPYAEIHAAPGFLTQQLQGFIFGLANNILGITMWIMAWGVGFHTWDELNSFAMLFGVTVSFFNTVFFLGFGLFPEWGGFCAAPLRGAAGDVGSIAAAFVAEQQLADTLYSTLVPGWLFSGFVMGQVMGNVWPNVQNFLLLIIVFVCDCLPFGIASMLTCLIPYNPEPSRGTGPSRITARQAELIFQPRELALAWDYASYLVMPTVCFSALFLLSPGMWRIFPVMLAWVVFMYSFHRFVTLHICKKQMHASANLVILAEFLWGVPLSVVAAAWAFWGYRLGVHGPELVPITAAASLLVYFFGMQLLGVLESEDLYGEEDDEYERVQKRLQFSWFNCNPVHLLKSVYCKEHLGGGHAEARAPFFFGKEYLLEEEGAADVLPQRLP